MKVTPQKQAKFCEKLAEGWSVTAASKAIGVTTKTAYEWRKKDAEFAKAWDDAIESGTDALEDEAQRRAMNTSDVLTIFLLKGRRPDKYRDRVDAHISGRLTLEQLVGQSMKPAAES